MIKFKYTALKNGTELIEGELEAANLREARALIRDLGFLPTKVYIENSDKNQANKKQPKSKITHLSLADKIQFTSHLENMLSAGIPIVEALQSIETNVSEKKVHNIAKALKDAIISGKTFSQALTELYGEAFGPVYTGLIKSGEESGELEVTLGRLLTSLNKQDDLKNKAISASIYPAILVVIMFFLLVLFAKLVFPAFLGILNNAGEDLPFLAQSLKDICSFISNYWWMVLIGFAATCGTIKLAFKNLQFKKAWDKFILKLPAIGDFIRYINLSNFLTVLHISYDAGVPIMSGLTLSNNTVQNYTLKKQVENANDLFKKGKPLSEALRISSFLPNALTSMIATGEKSGTLGKMLQDTVKTVDKKLDMAIQTMTKLFTPIITLIMGGVVLYIVLAFYQMYIQALGTLF